MYLDEVVEAWSYSPMTLDVVYALIEHINRKRDTSKKPPDHQDSSNKGEKAFDKVKKFHKLFNLPQVSPLSHPLCEDYEDPLLLNHEQVEEKDMFRMVDFVINVLTNLLQQAEMEDGEPQMENERYP